MLACRYIDFWWSCGYVNFSSRLYSLRVGRERDRLGHVGLIFGASRSLFVPETDSKFIFTVHMSHDGHTKVKLADYFGLFVFLVLVCLFPWLKKAVILSLPLRSRNQRSISY